MAQNRKPPAYQEYASELLANKHFRLMSLAERGLLYTLKLECWANNTIPSKTESLAKYLGISQTEVTNAFSSQVQAFVEVNGDDLTIPELDDYRKHLNEMREKQSKGGKNGSRKTNQMLGNKFTDSLSTSTSNSTSNSQYTRQGTNESLVKFKKVNTIQAQSVNNADTSPLNAHQEWLNDLERGSNDE